MEIPALVESQRAFFREGFTRDVEYRIAALELLRKALRSREGELLEALRLDLGKAPQEGYMTELGMVLEEIRFVKKRLRRWARPQRRPVPLAQFPASASVVPEPYGVALVMAPWNYPLQLSIAPLVGALAAGNCAVLKPSEDAPHTARVLEELLGEIFEPNYVAVIQGDREVGQELLEQRFDCIFYTGSPRVGRIVMEAAARTLTPVTLELGGKSPCIVDETADLPTAARRIVFGKFLNAGQTCVAPDYLLVQEKVKGRLEELLRKEIHRAFGETPLRSPDLARIATPRHFARLQGLLEGQKVVEGGVWEGQRMAPTLVDSPDPESPLMQEEIFGPILPILPFGELGEAVEFVAGREKPLALYLFSRDKNRTRQVLEGISSGGVCLGDTVVHLACPSLPFGGVGESGMGAYHGRASFDTFSHYRSVLVRKNRPDFPFRYPPYGEKKLAWIRRLMK